MGRPEVTVENHPALYEYYRNLEPHPRLVQSVHNAVSLVYRPRIHFAEGAEPEIADRVDSGDRLIMASNHFTIADQFPISAAVKQTDALRPLVGRIFALAKAGYFKKPYLRASLDATGTLPVFRPKDVQNKPKLQAQAAKSLIEASVDRIIHGWSMLIFPEGTRNTDDPHVLGKVQGGVGRIACSASEEVGVSIVPMALWYGQDNEQHTLRPDIFINNPLVGPFPSRHDVKWSVQSSLEDSVKRVVDMSL